MMDPRSPSSEVLCLELVVLTLSLLPACLSQAGLAGSLLWLVHLLSVDIPAIGLP